MRLFQKYWLLIILTTVAVVLVFFWVQARGQKEKVEVDTTLPKVSFPVLGGQKLPSNTKVTIQPSTTSADKTAVYQVDALQIEQVKALSIASTLGFPEQPVSINEDLVFGKIYLWLNKTQTLSVRLSPLDITMVSEASLSAPPKEGSFPTQESLLNTTKALLTKLGIFPAGVGFSPSVAKTILDGDILEVGIVPMVDGLPVLDTNPNTPLITAHFQKDGGLFGLFYKAGFVNPRNLNIYPTKTIDEIRKSLQKEGEVIVVGQVQEAPTLLVPSEVKITKMTSALLFYAAQPARLFPIFVLEGSAATQEGEVPTTIYMPSIKSVYLQTPR